LERHRDLATLGEGVEDALRLLDAVHLNVGAEARGPGVEAGRSIAAHDGAAVHGEIRVEHPVLPVGPDLVRHGRVGEGHQRLELAAQCLLVEAERLRAVAVEAEVGEELHRSLLPGVRSGWVCGPRLTGAAVRPSARADAPRAPGSRPWLPRRSPRSRTP